MKIKEFQGYLKEKNIDFSIHLNTSDNKQDPNVYYFAQIGLEFGCLVIPKNKRPFLIISSFEKERIKKYGIIKRAIANRKGKLFEQIKNLFKNKKIKRIGIDKNIFSLNEFKSLKKYFKKCKFRDISKKLSDLREIKTDKEIELIKKSSLIASQIINNCIKNFKSFKTESEVKNFLEIETKNHNCGLAFEPIVASGRNADLPHYKADNIKLKKGFCVIDFGVKFKGYCSDITRTIYIGKPSKKEIELYNFLLNLQKDIIKNLRINQKCFEVYNKAKKDLGEYKKYFTHGLGHGIGVEIHEKPNLSILSKDKIKEGMVFTIEPGIYIKNKLGIRIEDDILVRKNKIEILTKLKKELILIK